MTATTAQDVRHEPWCTEHQHQDADPATFLEEHDARQGVILRERWVEVVIEVGQDHGVVVDILATDCNLTPVQAREVAAAILYSSSTSC